MQEVGASTSDTSAAGSWDQYLVKRASELVTKIQSVSASESLEISTEKILENGMSSDHSKDDVRWMETVSFCLHTYLILGFSTSFHFLMCIM